MRGVRSKAAWTPDDISAASETAGEDSGRSAPRLNGEWHSVERCPACGGSALAPLGRLAIRHYVFLSRKITLPDGGIPLESCRSCGLVFKRFVPTPQFLGAAVASGRSFLWQSGYRYASELHLLDRLFNGKSYRLLDVGAAGGEFLDAAAARASCRSALDIIRFDRLSLSEDGEFIQGFIDDEGLRWSGVAYDVVTAFDVFEHFYSPQVAMQNLARLTAGGGILLIETGNAASVARRSLATWYYLAFFEHHMTWDPHSLTALAESAGFDVISIAEKRHKTIERSRFDTRAAAKYCLYSVAPAVYHLCQDWAGLAGFVPPKPNARDHIRAVLRRK